MFEIRQVTPDDISALYGLIEKLGFYKDEGYFEQCLAEQEDKKRQVFIINSGNDIGYGMLNWNPQYSLYKRLEIPEIQDLNVVPEARRKGAAGTLIAYCENIAREQGCEHIGISVGLYSDYGAAQRLYVKLGYVPDGNGVTYEREQVQPGEIRPVDDNLCLMMTKNLTES